MAKPDKNNSLQDILIPNHNVNLNSEIHTAYNKPECIGYEHNK